MPDDHGGSPASRRHGAAAASAARCGRSIVRVSTTCADCGCLVDRGVRMVRCGTEGCCCEELPTKELLDELARHITAAFAARDVGSFAELLAPDVRWGDDDAPNRCRSRADVIATFQRLLADGVGGEVTSTRTGAAGVLCRLRVHWPEPDLRERRGHLFHLYRVRSGQIVEIVPYGERAEAEAALAKWS